MNGSRTVRRLGSWCAAWAVLAASVALADAEPTRLKLLRPDSLAGWDHGAAPSGWIISQGRLAGTAQSTPLLSGWTVGDFELRFNFAVAKGGSWTLGLPEVPRGSGLQISLGEGDGCGAVRDADTVLSAGAKLDAASADATHAAVVRRSQNTLTVLVDGRVMSESTVDRNRRFGLSLAIAGGEATLANLTIEEPRGNSLFNGRDIDNWFVNNGKGEWKVDNGEITAIAHRGLHYLRTEREYANFTWSFEYHISKGGNSGVAIRTAAAGWPSGDGMEMQILDQPGEVKDSTMAIYGNLPPLDRADRSEQWNRVVIKADGRMISAWVNGELVQQANTAKLSEVKHRHLKGWLGLQDHGGKVRFREIYVLEAPDGLGLDAWYATPSESGAGLVLDRLMNSQRLSRADGITSGVVSKSVPKGGEHVLAELQGPGALVRLWQSFPAGRISFYFDGETHPRIECAAEHLAHSVPEVAHQERPLLTCLQYAKSLKIVLADPLAANYRIDYVTFPSDVPVDSYTPRRDGIPRGMTSAINYRHEGLSGGKLREAEIYDRIASEPKTIEAGTSIELAKLEGTGIVNWLKLRAPKAVLANNDLWIEVTIDGEALPAIAAPARYLFPAYAGESTKEFNTLVMAGREGFANLLAMPYGRGLTVAARNRGSQAIGDVAVSMSVDRATDANKADYANRMRLRGVFQAADSLQRDVVKQIGAGRWVSLVYQYPGEAGLGIAALAVDGKPCDGWAAGDLDAFWGRPGEGHNFYRALSGRQGDLAWNYMLLSPVEFQQSLVLQANPDDKLGDRLALFYLKN